jgi:hypothetical protein
MTAHDSLASGVARFNYVELHSAGGEFTRYLQVGYMIATYPEK